MRLRIALAVLAAAIGSATSARADDTPPHPENPAKALVSVLQELVRPRRDAHGDLIYAVKYLRCDGNENIFVDPSSPNYGIASISCSQPRIRAGSTARALADALDGLGIEADHAMGGNFSYSGISIKCTLHPSELEDSKRFSCEIGPT